MKVTALITEYNPFHNGHAYHMKEARRITGADFIIVVMSGNFVQRGEPAVFDKALRTEMALRCGADLVLELSTRFACGSAEYFAAGAVSLLNGLGCVDCLCFGSEAGNLSILSEIAEILAAEPENYKSTLREALKTGVSFPAAREKALAEILCTPSKKDILGVAVTPAQLHELLTQPNNILGIEYLKALKKSGSSIKPVTIQRIGNSYHDTDITGQFTSATALRKHIFEIYGSSFSYDFTGFSGKAAAPCFAQERFSAELSALLAACAPQSALEAFKTAAVPICPDDFSQMLQYRLMTAESWCTFASCFDVPEDLARRIFTMRYEFTSLTDFVDLLQTRNYTAPSVRRALLHILLQLAGACDIRESQYARILGLRRDSSTVLRGLREHGHLPLLSRLSDAPALLSPLKNPQADQLFAEDIRSSELYSAVSASKAQKTGRSEFSRPVVVV